ncbi:RraA family protein [Halalkalibacter oceani]|uniref:RraA family protein n=1 Tax=Halalkalibacter oceani TaxID=1653776 RepID=UPI00339B7C8C
METDGFQRIPTTAVADALQGLNTMDTSIKPLKPESYVYGKALTVKLAGADNFLLLQAISQAKGGEVLVVDGRGDQHHAVAGDFVVAMAKTMGLRGLVADGVIRDIQAINRLEFPVFCKGSTIAASQKHGRGETNVPISCGGVAVRPGDIVVGDADGVIIIPQEVEEQTVNAAKQKIVADEKRYESIVGNVEAVKNYINSLTNSHK